jgi:hypothetical protein
MMTIQRMENVGVVVDDLAAATAFILEPGLVLEGEAPVEGRDSYRLCYVRGPEGIIVALSEKLG